MKPADNINRLIRKSDVTFSTEIDKRILGDAFEHLEKLRQTKLAETRLDFWRTIMKNKITKLATAVAVILIAVLGITLLDRSTSRAWAIEEAIEALEKFNGILVTGIAVPEDGNGVELGISIWARPNEDYTQSSDILVRTNDGRITNWVKDNSTFHYDSKQNTVIVLLDQPSRVGRWLDAGLLQKLQQSSEDMEVLYGTDSVTNRDRAFVTFRSDSNAPTTRSYWFEFDLQTKLPVGFKEWNNPNREGKPVIDAQRIVYFDALPDEIFEFEVPEGATVIEK